MKLAAIVLCGGHSRRMGVDKALLDFHGEPMLTRVVRLLAEVVPPTAITCVAAARQTLPSLPPEVHVVHDRTDDCGPLEGMATGLAAAGEVDAAFVTTCDAPLLAPQLPAYLAGLLGEHDAVVPRIDGQLYPLTAVYRPSVRHVADTRLAAGERRVIDFVAAIRTRFVAEDELAKVDPELCSLRNCNTMDEYRRLLAADGRR